MSEFLLKPRICFGQDALSVLNELSARSVLLVTDQAMVKFGLAERVTALRFRVKKHGAAVPAQQQSAPVVAVKQRKRFGWSDLGHHATAIGSERPYLRLNRNSKT